MYLVILQKLDIFRQSLEHTQYLGQDPYVGHISLHFLTNIVVHLPSIIKDKTQNFLTFSIVVLVETLPIRTSQSTDDRPASIPSCDQNDDDQLKYPTQNTFQIIASVSIVIFQGFEHKILCTHVVQCSDVFFSKIGRVQKKKRA